MQMFRALRRRLGRALPAAAPVRVYLRPPPLAEDGMDRDGLTTEYCWHDDSGKLLRRRFVIYIDTRGDNEVARCEWLVHEWAHVLTGVDGDDVHTPEWGDNYGKAWDLWIDFLRRWCRRRD